MQRNVAYNIIWIRFQKVLPSNSNSIAIPKILNAISTERKSEALATEGEKNRMLRIYLYQYTCHAMTVKFTRKWQCDSFVKWCSLEQRTNHLYAMQQQFQYIFNLKRWFAGFFLHKGLKLSNFFLLPHRKKHVSSAV